MKQLIIIISLFLAGCATAVPVTQKFPSAPDILFEQCSKLNKLEENAKLSDLLTVVIKNYMIYHECAIKNQAWMDWYKQQKQIFDSATK